MKSTVKSNRNLKEGRNALTRALYVSKQFEFPNKRVPITEIEKNPLVAQRAVEKQLDSKEFLLSSFTAVNNEKRNTRKSNSPGKRQAQERRKDTHDSMDQVIMVPGPTGKEKLKQGDMPASPNTSFCKIKKQLTMTNYISRGLKDSSTNPFLVKNKEGVTPSLFQVDNVSNALSSVPLD